MRWRKKISKKRKRIENPTCETCRWFVPNVNSSGKPERGSCHYSHFGRGWLQVNIHDFCSQYELAFEKSVAPVGWQLTRPEATEALPYVYDCHVYGYDINGVFCVLYGTPNRTDRCQWEKQDGTYCNKGVIERGRKGNLKLCDKHAKIIYDMTADHAKDKNDIKHFGR